MAGLLGDRNTDGDWSPIGEINVTPMIDVMLVLLLVFMIAAPISTVNVPVDLPSESIKPAPAPARPVTISLGRDLSLYVGEKRTTPTALPADLRQAGATQSSILYLRIDKSVAYGQTLGVLDSLRVAGYDRIALVGVGKE